MAFQFGYLNDEPIIDVTCHPTLQGNANGPAMIAAPAWIVDPPGKYLLYFAHHEGHSIRLAYSDSLQGPWKLHDRNPLELSGSLFATEPVKDSELHPEARAYIDAGADGNYPHIASPDIWLDNENKTIRLYFHGRMANGLQRTRVALSSDAVTFRVQEEILGLPYFRVFTHQDYFYALAMPAQLYRSHDGLSQFEAGPVLTREPIRHHAMLQVDQSWFFFWTRVGDSPERILVSRLNTDQNWHQWTLQQASELHRPKRCWEGAGLPVQPSQYGATMQWVNQLRDPFVFEENGKKYLLYSVAGEKGIGIGELTITERIS